MKTYASPLGDIFLGQLTSGLNSKLEKLYPGRIVLIADSNTNEHCVPILEEVTGRLPVIVVPAGEQHKTIHSCQQIWSALNQYQMDRSGLILNVGGGMICDLGGFAASCFHRGISFVHIPTSLLAMTDAAIGGKTGIDFEGFKNNVGLFAHPVFTWVDPVFLKTLSSHDLNDGLAEIVKHAIIGSDELWSILEHRDDRVEDWETLLKLSIPVKQTIVENDPKEKGQRKILNFGHTIGHALESHFLQTSHPLTHGQAVTLGMMAEAKIARIRGLIENEDFERILRLILRLLHPAEVTLPAFETLDIWLRGDKKRTGHRLGFSLPTGIGSGQWDIDVSREEINLSLAWLSRQVMPSDQR